MSKTTPRYLVALSLGFMIAAVGMAQKTTPTTMSEASLECIECHASETTGIYQEWGSSKHYRGNVGCYECHRAEAGDADAFEHYGYSISIIVSPQDCARCHEKEVAEFDDSHHAKAGLILGSLDNFLADIVEGDTNFYGGSALTVSGCKQCHGGVVEVNEDGSLAPTGWPNTGMGRVNPDGSIGACTACHQRHAFSAEQARRPENCGKCHLGPDHPQMEIYEESKHGIAYRAHEDDLNLDSSKWVLGEDYTAAPTCATCHMSAVRTSERRAGAGDSRRGAADQLEQPPSGLDSTRDLRRQARPREDGPGRLGRAARQHGRGVHGLPHRALRRATSTSSTTASSRSTTRSSPIRAWRS